MKKGWYLVIAGFIVVGGAGIALRQPTIDVPIRAENGTFTYRCKAHDAVVASAQAAHDAYTQQLKETAKVHGAVIAKILNAPSSPGGAAAIEEAGAQYYAEAQHLRETINSTFGCLPPIRQD